MCPKRIVPLGVLASGTGTNLQAIMDAAKAGRIDAAVRVVISDNPSAYALERARRAKIPGFPVERGSFGSRNDFESAIVDRLKEHEVELICLAGYMRIVGPALLKAFPHRILNIHPALLPAFPGLEAQQQAFEYGVKVSGCTVHFVDAKVDHGPIICQTAVEVHEDDTLETLRQRILKEEHRLYPRAIQLYAEGRLKIEGRHVRVT
jgi:phosphoribosylglycinamide formyltransferase-1